MTPEPGYRANGPRRILHLWLPGLAIERLERKPDARPAAIVHTVRGRRTIIAACPQALAAGVTPGRPPGDAQALVPELCVIPADPPGQRATLDSLADRCARWSPMVAADPPADGAGDGAGDGGLWLDVTGCAHLFGGETAMCRDIAARFAERGWTVRLALADTPGAAWAVARFAQRRIALIAPGGQRAAIGPLPVAALRLPAATVEGLEKVGLRRVDTLCGIARAPLATRFGPAVTRRLDQALGAAPEPIFPRPPASPHRVRLSLPEPVSTPDSVGAVVRRLLERMVMRMRRADLGVRRLELVFHRVDGSVKRFAVGTSRPGRDADALYRLLAEHLDRLDPGFGIETATLEAVIAEPFNARVPDFSGRTHGIGLHDLHDRIANRLGTGAVRRAVPHESHLPERAESRAPAVPAGWPADTPGPDGARPLRLLNPPEPVAAVALLPDHPPVRFRWRGIDIRVVRSAGPERLAPEWWRGAGRTATRDYFRVEDGDGRRYWLFREGLAERGETPAWHLHGLFA